MKDYKYTYKGKDLIVTVCTDRGHFDVTIRTFISSVFCGTHALFRGAYLEAFIQRATKEFRSVVDKEDLDASVESIMKQNGFVNKVAEYVSQR